MCKVIFEFPSDETRDSFLGWMSDGGGESNFMDISESDDDSPVVRFNYSKAFPAWGYDPETDGDPVVKLETE